MIEFKVCMERTDSDEGWEVKIETLPTEGMMSPGASQTWNVEGLEQARSLVHDWMVDNIQEE